MGNARIPQDWVMGNPTRDVTITMPDSPGWRGLLVGYFARLIYDFEWDADTEFDLGGAPTLIQRQVYHSDHDAHQAGDVGSPFTSTLRVRCDSDANPADRWDGGVYFDNITIPQGETITMARIGVYPEGLGDDDPNADIYGHLTPSASDFNIDNRVRDRENTVNSVAWIAEGVGEDLVWSPDISDIIQELVDQVGWVSGNNIAFIIRGRTDINRDFDFVSFDQTPANAPMLEIEYGGGGAMTVEDAIQATIDALETYQVAP